MNKKVLVKFPNGEYKEIEPELLVEVPFEGQQLYLLQGSGYVIALRRDEMGNFTKVPLHDQEEYDRFSNTALTTIINRRRNGEDPSSYFLSFDILPDVINDVEPSKRRTSNSSQEQFSYTLQDQETIYIDPETFVNTRNVPEMDYHIYVPLLITDFDHTKPRKAFHSRGCKTEGYSTEWEHYYEREEGLPRDVQIAINNGNPHQRLDISIDGRKNPYVQCYDEETNTMVTRILFPGIINFHISFHPSFNNDLIDSVNGSKRISVIENTESIYSSHSEPEYCFSRGMLEKMPVITQDRTFGYDESSYGKKK